MYLFGKEKEQGAIIKKLERWSGPNTENGWYKRTKEERFTAFRDGELDPAVEGNNLASSRQQTVDTPKHLKEVLQENRTHYT